MAISGYSPLDTNIAVFNKNTNEQVAELKREEIITKVSISKRKDNKYSEIAVPFIINTASFKLECIVSTRSIKQHLPARMDGSRIALLFFEKSIKDGEVEKKFFDWENMSGHKGLEKEEVTFGNNEIRASYFFKINPSFLFSKKGSFLRIGLRVHDLLIKNLVCDLAVFSSANQLSADNRPILSTKKDNLQKAFWFSEEIFKKKEPANAKIKTEIDSEELDDVEELIRRAANEKDSSKKQLYELMKITRESFEKMQKLVNSKEAIDANAIATMVREQIEASAKLVENPQNIIPSSLRTASSFLNLSSSFIFNFD